MWIILFIVAVITIPTGILIYSVKRRNNEEWVGVLEDKKVNTYYRKGQKTNYMLYFRDDSGKKVVSDVSQATYNSINIGDRVKKSKGQLDPVRIS